MLLKMAYRNIYRHKHRTILTLITIVFGVFIGILGDGFMSGLERQLLDIYRNTETGDFKIYQKGFYANKEDGNPLDYLIENEKELLDLIENLNYSKRLSFQGRISTGREELRVNFLGVNSRQENKVFQRNEYMEKGEFNLQDKELIIGSALANLLNLNIGSEVTIITRTTTKSMNAYDLTVTGIIKTGNPLLDESTIFINLKFAKEFTLANKINDIALLGFINNERKLADKSIEIISLEEIAKDPIALSQTEKKIYTIISLIILIMAGVSIANTMIMVMMERKKEIGVMTANGMNGKNIVLLFLNEGLIIGFIGSILGGLLGIIPIIYFSKVGIPLSALDEMHLDFPMSSRIYTYMDFFTFIVYILAGIFIAVIATLYPAYQASKLNPVEVLRD